MEDAPFRESNVRGVRFLVLCLVLGPPLGLFAWSFAGQEEFRMIYFTSVREFVGYLFVSYATGGVFALMSAGMFLAIEQRYRRSGFDVAMIAAFAPTFILAILMSLQFHLYPAMVFAVPMLIASIAAMTVCWLAGRASGIIGSRTRSAAG